jgi:DHA1 family multidrug resistance protein-like MFS transporter
MAYISDSTSARQRGGGMGLMGAAMGVGMVLGPGIAGLLAEEALSTPFFLAAGLSLVALALIWALLPESLTPARRLAVQGKIRGPQFGEMWAALFSPIGLLLFMAFLVTFGLTNFEAIFGLFALEKYGYGPKEVGGLLSVIGVISAIVQGGLTGPATRRWGEPAVIKASLLASALAYPLMLWAFNLPTVVLTVGIFVFSNAMLHPSVSSLISQRATIGQGVALGLNNSFMSLGRIAGPLLAGFLFDQNINLPYWIGGVVMLAGFVVALARLGDREPAPSPQPTPGTADPLGERET